MANAPIPALSAEQQRQLLAELLRRQSEAAKRFPMSAGQQGLWHAYRRDPQLTAFNVFLPTRIRGTFSLDALQASINFISRRHAALRTTFNQHQGSLVQIVHDDLMPQFTLTEMLGASDEAVRQRVMLETLVPFDLVKGPLLRLSVYKLADNDWVILAMTHHIIVDFWSLVLILGELKDIYPKMAKGQTPDLPQPVDNYRQFVQDQQQWLASEAGQRLIDYWLKQVDGVSPVLELPLDKPRPAAFSHRADCCPIPLSGDVGSRVSRFAGQHRATPFAVVHSAMQLLLQRYCRQDEFFVGSPFAGRPHQRYERTVGFFINMLPVRATIDGNMTFSQLAQQTTQRLVDTLENQALPIAQIVQRAGVARDASRSPLFQISCTYERAQTKDELGRAGFLFPDRLTVFDFGGLHQESFYIPHPTCHYDLEFVFEHSLGGLQGMLIYCRDLFTGPSMQQLANNYAGLLDSLLENSDKRLKFVPWLVNAGRTDSRQRETKQLTRSTNQLSSAKSPANGTADFQDRLLDPEANEHGLVHRRIVRRAEQQTGGLAMITPTAQLSLMEVVGLAGRVCRDMQKLAIGVDTLVPVVCRNGAVAFIGMLAVQLSGGTPVPIDLTQPSIDWSALIEDIQPVCTITDDISSTEPLSKFSPLIALPTLSCIDPHQQQDLSAEFAQVCNSRHWNIGTDCAYMIYTSGSTGVPKGVLMEHSAIVNTLQWRQRALPLTPDDRVLMLLSHQFDAAVGIGWSCLEQGATLVWPDEMTRRDPELLIDFIQRQRITVLPAIPSLLRILVTNDRFTGCKTLRQIWLGGQAVPNELPEQIRAVLNVSIWNLYGPTETAVEATAIDITNHSSQELMTIGYAIDNTQVVVVDDQCQPVPDTVPGQLAIGGRGLARGYHGDPELTQRKFIVDSGNSTQRLYLTGDIGRKLADGRIEFLGRDDFQIKLRGYRIELGEIESILQSHPHVDRAAVVVNLSNQAEQQLIAYACPRAGHQLDRESLRSFMISRLAQYKLPSTLILLDSLPFTSSGKVDRKRLPLPTTNLTWIGSNDSPRNSLEQYLVQAWCSELRIDSVGIHQNFFQLGGSSLQAAILTTQLSADLKVHVPTALLFDLADIAQLAERLAMLHPQVLAARFGADCLAFYEQSDLIKEETTPHPLLAPLKHSGDRPPIFMVHPPGGIVVCYRELARYLPAEQPLWAIRSHGLHGHEQLPESIQQMAEEYLQAVRHVQPNGPYILGGWSLGGLVAYEMAQQLLTNGESLQRLVFLDTTIPTGACDLVPLNEQVNVGMEYGIELTLDQLGELTPEQQLPLLHDHADKLGIVAAQSHPEVVQRVLHDLQGLFHHHVKLSRNYRLQPIDAKLLLLRPQEVPYQVAVTEDRGWRHLCRSVEVQFVPGHHHSMVQSPHVARLAERLSLSLRQP